MYNHIHVLCILFIKYILCNNMCVYLVNIYIYIQCKCILSSDTVSIYPCFYLSVYSINTEGINRIG